MGLRQMVLQRCGIFLEVFMALAMALHSKMRPLALEPSLSPATRRRYFSFTGSEKPKPSAPNSFRQSPPGIDAHRSIAQEKCPSFESSTASCPGLLASSLMRSACNLVRNHPIEVQHEISSFLTIHPRLAPRRLPAARRPGRQILLRAQGQRACARADALAENHGVFHEQKARENSRSSRRPARAEFGSVVLVA